jgi:hypothetical protein
MNWFSWDVATSILGVISGFIFFVDGWRRSPRDILSFRQTSRITGLAWLVGGGALTGLFTYLAKGDQGRAMMMYVIFFGITLLLILALAAALVALYSISRNYRQKPLRVVITDSIPYTLSFLASGLDQFLERIKEEESKASQTNLDNLQRSRINLLQFVNDMGSYLVRDLGRGEGHFKLFLAPFLRSLAVMFFEQKDVLESYRAAFFALSGEELVFVEGADVQGLGYEFSGQPLSLAGSLAGRAFRENKILRYPEDAADGFQPRSHKSLYKSTVAVPVPFKLNAALGERIGVLCVDSVIPNVPFDGEFERRLLIYTSNMIAAAYSTYFP